MRERMSRLGRGLSAAVTTSIVLLAGSANAQFGVQWLTLTKDPERLQAPGGGPADLVASPEEKDFAWGDLDRDGWSDLVVVQKTPGSFAGKRPGRLFLNDHGRLIDRTAQFASASLTPFDLGLAQPIDARDVELADLDGDGWLDLVTSQTDYLNDVSPLAKVVTHPRVHRNLGAGGAGDWLGLRHEDFRIPLLLTLGGIPGAVRFSDLAAGDVDQDGDVDLYFVDCDTDLNGHTEPVLLDLNDRLLLNDGTGFFTDLTSVQFASADMWSSAEGTECDIADVNGDGRLDVVKVSTTNQSPANRTEVLYNDSSALVLPNGTGAFDAMSIPHTGEPYHAASADLNNDGRLDHVASGFGSDKYRFNLGNDGSGAIVWSAASSFSFLTGSSDQSPSGSIRATDFDLDGWNDALIVDVNFDLLGCARRTQLFHNQGGTPGSTSIVLREEAQQSGLGGWKGAAGWSANDPKGVFDAAVFDLDHDGDEDLVLGRCTGAEVWLNGTNPVTCAPSVVPASKGDLSLSLCGAPLWSGLSATLAVGNGPPLGTAVLLVGLAPTTVPALGGQVLSPIIAPLVVTLPLGATGAIAFPIPGGGTSPAGFTFYVQAIGATGVVATEISNVLAVTLFD